VSAFISAFVLSCVKQRPCDRADPPSKESYQFSTRSISIYSSTALVDLQLLNLSTESIGLPGQGMSPSQGRYLHTGQHKNRINAHKYSCLEWDSKTRALCSTGRRRFILRRRGHCDRHKISIVQINSDENKARKLIRMKEEEEKEIRIITIDAWSRKFL
jgi:hypothetical protein